MFLDADTSAIMHKFQSTIIQEDVTSDYYLAEVHRENSSYILLYHNRVNCFKQEI